MSRKKYPQSEDSLGGRLRIYRETHHKTITEFAKLLEISQGSLSDLENNKTKPSSIPLGNIIHKTDISVYWLYMGIGDMTRTEAEIRGQAPELGPTDPTIRMLLESARGVLESGNQPIADSMARSIRYFEKTLEADTRTAALEKKLDQVIEEVKNLRKEIKTQDHPEEEQAGETTGAAAA